MIGDSFLADTHIHSHFSHDSDSKMADICRAAKEKNIGVVCITDHADVKPHSDLQEMAQNRQEVYREIRETACEGVELLVGIELACGGFYPDNSIFDRATQTLLTVGQYDCVIGSVHSVGATSTARNDYAAMSKMDLVAYLDRYFDAALAMLEYGKPDVLAHLTYPLRYINGKFGKEMDWRLLEPKIRLVLQTVIQNGIALEINTSCLGTEYDQLLPNEDILKLYLQMGGKLLTLGSDAHKAEKLGKGFGQTVQLLKSLGVTELQYVKKRKFHAYKI